MRPSRIRMLIKLVEESNIGELEVSSWGQKVCIRKKAGSNGDNPHHNPVNLANLSLASTPPPPRLDQLEIATQGPKAQATKTALIEVKSPMVGTFYKAPAPDAKPYVEIGQMIKPGQVVCIIEAMKLMNEIEAETSGRIVEVLVENAKPVQFGQPLFLIEPA
ncbi:MAG TPA: acetyl-CoA carboxylase, biotin carboxyl carrier protein [candidate division Zixibacteria bacterium]|jgi:acetyl-CoA carboxylase biotin carboxyl carrier protein|nr:acetyl-CoA carboxylase, biotin carboxyl carrier protein [candidate division Zixibacteria bacterium]HBZ01619.1 acetyl-CoA carboxylase, biotin carboxyl carrier protein [candidate division Zixibacteria bacterium]